MNTNPKEYRIVSGHNRRVAVWADVPRDKPFNPNQDAETLYQFLKHDVHEFTFNELKRLIILNSNGEFEPSGPNK